MTVVSYSYQGDIMYGGKKQSEIITFFTKNSWKKPNNNCNHYGSDFQRISGEVELQTRFSPGLDGLKNSQG